MLRSYQASAINQVRLIYLNGVKKVLLVAPTGSGKTVIFCEMVKSSLKKGKRILIVVKGRELVKNASDRLLREKVDHGVFMSNHYLYDPDKPVQVCSIDTIRSRLNNGTLFLEADIIVFDEAHFAVSRTYRDFISKYSEDTYILAVTATPFVKEGLRHVADEVVQPIKMKELIEEGFLCPPVYFAEFAPDLNGVGLNSKGDYIEEELDRRLNNSHIVGDYVNFWKENGENRATICFAINVSHSQRIVDEFKKAGVEARHIDAESTDEERQDALKALKSGEIKVVSNVNILTVGVDMPYVSCLIMARPTKSLNLYIQMGGRGTRTCEEIGKKNFYIFDHAGNVAEHGLLEDDREVSLDPVEKPNKIKKKKKIEEEEDQSKIVVCSSCAKPVLLTKKKCECGALLKAEEREIVHDTSLQLIAKSLSEEDKEQISKLAKLRKVQKDRKYHKNWIHYKVRDLYGESVADRLAPHAYKERFGHYPVYSAR